MPTKFVETWSDCFKFYFSGRGYIQLAINEFCVEVLHVKNINLGHREINTFHNKNGNRKQGRKEAKDR